MIPQNLEKSGDIAGKLFVCIVGICEIGGNHFADLLIAEPETADLGSDMVSRMILSLPLGFFALKRLPSLCLTWVIGFRRSLSGEDDLAVLKFSAKRLLTSWLTRKDRQQQRRGIKPQYGENASGSAGLLPTYAERPSSQGFSFDGALIGARAISVLFQVSGRG
jgi:hypothetical protein